MAELTIDWRSLFGESFRNARVLVTGGAGFIGSHLAEALVQLGASVAVLDDLSGGSRDNLRTFGPIEFIQGTILDRPVLDACVRGCRYVFHQAALGSVPGSVEQPQKYYEANSTGTQNVLESARAAGVRRVMFAASASAYGNNDVPWVETMPAQACSPYAATKVAGEALLRAYASVYPLDTAALRYFNIFGPRQNANSAYAAVIASFAKALVAEQHPIIFGDGEQSRDFTYVANVVYANLLAANHPARVGGQVLNVGCGKRISVNMLAKVMANAMGRPDLTPVHQAERAGDLKHSYADLDLVRSVLKYEPIVDFGPGLEATMAWYKSVLA